PLFQVMLVLQNAPRERLELRGLSWRMLRAETNRTKFDLTVTLEEGPRGLRGAIAYSTELFEAETVKRMVGHFERLLAALVAKPQGQVRAAAMLSEAEDRK